MSIIHHVDRLDKPHLAHYLCNEAVEPTPSKSTMDYSKVTCKNCLRVIKKLKVLNQSIKVINMSKPKKVKAENEHPEDLKELTCATRCINVQKFILGITSSTNKDEAYAKINHVKNCSNCQGFLMDNLNISGNKALEEYISEKLGEKHGN